MKLAVNVAINSLSFGQTSVAILREMYHRGLSPCIFPIANNVDTSSQKPDEGFNKWLQGCISSAQQRYHRSMPCARLWHISDSISSYCERGNDLITFQESGSLTTLESNVLKQQRRVIVTNRYAKSFFENCGIDTTYVSLGFDAFNFHVLQNRPHIEGVTSWLLTSKAEKRKHTYRQLALWAKRYGNNKDHRLNCAISNTFLKPEDQNALIGQALGGKQYWNINFIPFSPTNAEYNSVLQSSEIILCCSGSEGFGLPEYHAAAMGAWPIALDAHSYKDFFTPDNAVLIKPNGMEPIYDGIFFHPGQPLNQGNVFTFADEDFYTACDEAEKRAKIGLNTKGMDLQRLTYKQTVDEILKVLES